MDMCYWKLLETILLLSFNVIEWNDKNVLQYLFVYLDFGSRVLLRKKIYLFGPICNIVHKEHHIVVN